MAHIHEEVDTRHTQPIRVYMLEMWSFIPYYVAALYRALHAIGLDITLGTTRYHLDRDYFFKTGVKPDAMLLDVGGGLRSNTARRVVKSIEYIANLCGLLLRFSMSPPQILHVQYLPFIDRGLTFEIWFLRLVRRLGIRVVYTVHNVTYQNSGDRHKYIYQKLYRVADALICHGPGARARLIHEFGISGEKIHIIPHGPLFQEHERCSSQDARARLGLSAEEALVLSAGVISEYKGIPFLLDAWKRALEMGGKGRLIVAGTGEASLLTAIRQQVAADELTSSVSLRLYFIPVEELPLLHQAADVLVYPYKEGTTSGALQTGLSYGKAILATKLPLFQEHLTDGKNAALVSYGDVDALAGSLKDLLNNPAERARIADSSTPDLSTQWRDIARTTRQVYEDLLLPSGSPQLQRHAKKNTPAAGFTI